MRGSTDPRTPRIPWPAYPAAGLTAAGLAFASLYFLYPVLSDTMATRRIRAAIDGRWNALYHAAPVVPGAEPLPRSSPDILYSFAPLVIGQNPVLLEVELRDDSALHYWALSVFAPDLTNLFVTDDLDPPGKTRRKYVFVAPGVSRERADPDATPVEIAGSKALLIMQYVPASASDRETVDEMRRRARLYELWMKL
jgi:hypothetical protein